MANNFRIIGGAYISKDGNDANSGLTQDLPKATFNSYVTGKNIVGTGVYKAVHTLSNAILNIQMIADTLVVLNCLGNFIFGYSANNGYSKILGSLTEGGFFVLKLNGYDLVVNIRSGGPGAIGIFNRVIVIGGNISFGALLANNNLELNNCIFESVTGGTVTYRMEFKYSSIFNSTLDGSPSLMKLENSYVDSATTITLSSYFSTPATQFYNNCFQGILNIGGTLYELKKDKDGNTINPNPAVNDLVLIDATVYDRGNFSQDPEFLNIEKRDYWSVANTSPLLFADSTTIGNIANVKYAVVKKTTDLEFSSGTITDLTTLANDYVIQSPATNGQMISQPIQIAPIPQVLDILNFAKSLNFNSDLALGDSENNNVMVSQNYVDGTAGANPRRLTYEMRWSTQSTIPTLDAHWDNNGYNAGNYLVFELDTVPKVSFDGVSTFYGNGSPEYNESIGGNISAKWVQFRVKIFNGIG